ncbi:MAG: glycosyltransferase family 9 protein [Desulfobacterales bacterium]|nr:glycosyltransferase family 9 protein [Desulfobacterales bacterium]
MRILIIKVGSTGDVLRTTGLLKAIKVKYPNSHITWITAKGAQDLLENNEMVDAVLATGSSHTLLTLQTTRYDLAINLDADRDSAMLVTYANAVTKCGYGYSNQGYVFPLNQAAHYWFQLGLSDTLKKANTKTYQRIMFEICNLDTSVSAQPVLIKSKAENRLTRQFRAKHGIGANDIVIGLNTGAGNRWPLKKWTIENYLALIAMLNNAQNRIKIVLYGGPGEKSRNIEIMQKAPADLIDSGCDNSLREEIALLDAADLLVTGDTLVMHMGIALNKYILLLLGPTSYHEIDLFGNGQKITSDLDCLCCYSGNCSRTENCMNSISAQTVYDHIINYIERAICSESS